MGREVQGVEREPRASHPGRRRRHFPESSGNFQPGRPPGARRADGENEGRRTAVTWRHSMKLTELFLGELDREAPLTRRVLERVPEGRNDWQPHKKSMPPGRRAAPCAGVASGGGGG